jgi:hypothetical protein
MLISLGFYYLNHTNTGNFKKLNSNKKLSSLKLNERKFEYFARGFAVWADLILL